MATISVVMAIVANEWPILLAGLLITLSLTQAHLLRSSPIAKVPVIGSELGSDEKRRQAYLRNARQLYLDGYQKFKNGMFRIVSPRKSKVIVMSPKFLQELSELPDNVLSFDAAIEETMQSKYTQARGTGAAIIPHTIKTHLTPALVRLNPSIASEVQEALELEMPPCDDWTPINLSRKMIRVVVMVSGRVFIGPELCRDERYIDAAINYSMDLMKAQQAVSMLPEWKRPFLASHLPPVKALDKRFDDADAFLRPLVASRRAMDPKERPDDLVQWLLNGEAKFGATTTEKLAEVQLGISFAAIHTTTLTTTNAFYNLAAMPELAQDLREEIRSVLAEHNNVFTSSSMQAMKKLDSFMKETLRFHPAFATSFQRKTLRPFTLSNGQRIPAGVIIEVPVHAVSSDSEVFPNADKFDPYRFYKLRQEAKEEGAVDVQGQNQFVSVTQKSLTFGYGRHACPGRFFAANEMKMILANVLLKYELQLADGATERYPNIEFSTQSIPDPKRNVLFKKIA
ncbi:cytochrome P450 [Hypoxylon trugodes]|uniref:cytochrome P450 n=1 Tax=Hypoxylon trugodes TaxID=326681 RepID=UPI00219A27D2|nr:cytochrome P450 [Hypoxylon trugodes]KAI1389674.1 cytochrome P450 [Hypoxylon trugodes]